MNNIRVRIRNATLQDMNSDLLRELLNTKERGPEELRRELFGENCQSCGTHSKEMKHHIDNLKNF